MNENMNKSEEQIREEAKAEFEKEMQIKEQAKQELLDEQRKIERTKRKKENIRSLIYRIIFGVIFLFVLFETVIGVLDMQRLNDDKKPVWYIDEKVENKEGVIVNINDLSQTIIVPVKITAIAIRISAHRTPLAFCFCILYTGDLRIS